MTHFSHHYSTWDFTHMSIPNNLSLTCKTLPICKLQCLSMGHEQLLLASPCLMGFFFHWCIIHGPLHVTKYIFYPLWEPRTSSLSSTIRNNISLLGPSKIFYVFLSHVSLCFSVCFKTSPWPWTSPTCSPLPNRLFPSLVHYPWAYTCQPCTSLVLHGSLALLRYLAPLAIILFCWAFPRSFISALWACSVQYTVSAPTAKGTHSAPFVKGFQVHIPCSHSNYERNLDNLATFAPTPPWTLIALIEKINTLGSYHE